MQLHPIYGAETLSRIRGASELALITAFEHHLRYDGSGYPCRREDWPLNMLTHLTAIADTYDAMRSHRPYDGVWPCEKVYRTMMNLSGQCFHPGLLERFFRIVGVYSPDTLVRLKNGEVGAVVENTPLAVDRPVIRVFWTPAKGSLPEPYLIDIAAEYERAGEAAPAIGESLNDGDESLPSAFAPAVVPAE